MKTCTNWAVPVTLYTQLITQNKVNIPVSDFGSVPPSVAVPIAQEHKMVLFDQDGSAAALFGKTNPYIVDTWIPTADLWSTLLAHFLIAPRATRSEVFACKDREITIGVGNDRPFAVVSRLLGHPEWSEDERYATNPQRADHSP